jgi:hypothetical protein
VLAGTSLALESLAKIPEVMSNRALPRAANPKVTEIALEIKIERSLVMRAPY